MPIVLHNRWESISYRYNVHRRLETYREELDTTTMQIVRYISPLFDETKTSMCSYDLGVFGRDRDGPHVHAIFQLSRHSVSQLPLVE